MAIRKAVTYILFGLTLFALLFYLVFFFTVSEATITGEINRLLGKGGYEIRAGGISKHLPLTVTLEDVTVTGGLGEEEIFFPRLVLRIEILKFFGGMPIELTLHDGGNSTLRARISRNLDSLAVEAADFSFSPKRRKRLPSFFAPRLSLDLKDIRVDEGGALSMRGKGAFYFEHLTVAGQYGMDLTLTGLEGRVLFRERSLYFKGARCTLLSSTFDFDGTVTNYQQPLGSSLDIVAEGEEISPLVANLLKLRPENEYNVKIRIRGSAASPQITVMQR